ncbi:MAG TPA: penicillin-binding protein 2 [Bacillales bacterium]|nr:penicillin-binding protein 2 [Bacillales bacterium]
MVGQTKSKPKNAKPKKKNQVPFRLNVLFIVVFVLFSILILRLGIVQIVEGETYKQQVKEQVRPTSKLDAARGLIYDTNGELLVGNKGENAITFTRTKDDSAEDLLHLAEKLTEYIHMDPKKLTVRDKKDYWILKHGLLNAYHEKLSDEEYNRLSKSDDKSAAYDALLDRITKENIDSLTNHDLQVAAIFRKLNQAMNLTPYYVKIGIEDEAFYKIGEHLESLPGIDLTQAAKRVYPNGDPFYLGSVGEIPRESLDYYLARGYNRNDLVGTSYLEQYYENLLNGTPTKLQFQLNEDGELLANPKQLPGHRGYDIQLTINLELQKKVQEILKAGVRDAMFHWHNPYLNSAYAVVMNPQTGGILALNGVEYEDGQFNNVSYQTITGSFVIGSNIKGATVLAGFETNTVPSAFNDKKFVFKNGNDLQSYPGNNIGVVTPVTALEASSNIFMAKIAANMAGFKTVDKGSYYRVYTYRDEQYFHAFHQLREIYSQFGLGIRTQIDLPKEGLGYEGDIDQVQPGQILRFAFGQFDTYTPIQVAQYFSTIANGGYRLQLHLLKSVHEPNADAEGPGELVYQFEPNVLNHITMNQHALEQVHKGFWLVTHGARVYSHLPTAPQLGRGEYEKYEIAGKTGTADVTINGHETVNELFSGYAPAGEGHEPEVTVVVIVPGDDNGGHHIKLAGQIFKAYFEMKNGS